MSPGQASLEQARSLIRDGSFDEADAVVDVLLADTPTKRPVLVAKATIAERTARWGDALAVWFEVDRHHARNPQWFKRTAVCLLRLDRPGEALDLLEAGAQANRDDAELHRRAARLAHELCEFDRADALLTHLVSLRPSAHLLLRLADNANNRSDGDAMRQRLRSVADGEGADDADAQQRLAWRLDALSRLGERDEAHSTAAELADAFDRQPSLEGLRALVRFHAGEADVAALRSLLDRADVTPTSHADHADLADLAVMVEEDDRAAALIESLDGDSRKVLELNAWHLVRQGRVDEARGLIDSASYPHSVNHLRARSATEVGSLRAVRVVDGHPDGVVVYAVGRDEQRRLPQWLDHYRSLGVNRFVVIDNASVDGTRALLLDQPDVDVYASDEGYLVTASGRRWIDQLAERRTSPGWNVVVDIDEFMVLPDAETIESFVAGLADEVDLVAGLMIDMHGQSLDAHSTYEPGAPLAATFRWFDTHTALLGSRHAPYVSGAGGFRTRGLGSVMPERLLTKPALIRAGRHTTHLNSHTTRPTRSSDATVALLHYKFAVDPGPRSQFQSSKGALLGALALQSVGDAGHATLIGPTTAEYTGPNQLIQLGMLRRGK